MAHQNITLKEKIKLLKKNAKLLSQASKWGNSGKTVSRLNLKTDDTEDYIYELYFALKLLCDLLPNYIIELKKGTKHGYKFPRKPGNWKNFAYFKLKDKNKSEVFEIHLGVFIEEENEKYQHAPDLCVTKELNNEHDKIKSNECYFIVDCKYKYNLGNEEKEIDSNQYYKVSGMAKTLNINSPKTDLLILNQLYGLIGNTLVTNASAFFDDPAMHSKHDVMEIENFEINKIYNIIGFS